MNSDALGAIRLGRGISCKLGDWLYAAAGARLKKQTIVNRTIKVRARVVVINVRRYDFSLVFD